MDTSKILPTEITTEMETAYLDYAMSVIVARALPDVRDGLKPVHRRIIYAMHKNGMHHTAKYQKSAAVVGEVLKTFHPHGDIPVYDALVRMAQDFSLRYPLIDGQGNFGCFAGETLVRLADGSSKSFTDLVKDYKSGKTYFTFAVNNGQIEIVPILAPRLTKKNTEVVKVTLDNNESVVCTPDHRFMLRDRSYREAKDLQKDDSLMPLYSRAYEGENKNLQKYEEIYQPATNSWKFTHVLADECNIKTGVYTVKAGKVRHHKDLNKFNNDPTNIVRMQWADHRRLHMDLLSHMWDDPKFRKKMSAQLKDMWTGPEFRKKTIASTAKRNAEIWKKPEFKAKRLAALAKLWRNPEFRKKILERGKETNILVHGTPQQKEAIKQAQLLYLKRQWQDPKYRDDQRKRMQGISDKLWADPNHRKLVSESATKQWTKEYRLEKSNLAKNQWKDPKYRALFIGHHSNNGNRTAMLRFLSLAKKAIEHDGELTPAGYERERHAANINMLIQYETGLKKYFENDPNLAQRSALTYTGRLNHRVVSVEKSENTDVYDISISGLHNFSLAAGVFVHNSMDGDPPAAMRYTEARLAAISDTLLQDIDKETVDFIPNYSNTDVEPTFLPSILPNLLLMGAEGIAVGMATKIPPHNLTEVVNAIIYLIDHWAKVQDVTVEDLIQFVKGPDFPTGGIIYDQKEIIAAYATGKGRVITRAKTAFEEISGGKTAIIATELPYQVNKACLVARIAELVKDKKLDGISDLRDESDRHGVRVVIELKRDAKPQQVLNNLFKHTELQTSYPVNVVALVDQTPQTLTLKMILEEFVKHRQHIVRKRSEFELREAKARAHILEGLKIAVDNIDEVIAIIKKAPSADEAKIKLMDRFKLSDLQATAILDMQLRRLAALERKKLEEELADVMKLIKYLEDLLAHVEKMMGVIKDELLKLKEKFGDERRTKVIKGKVGEFSDEDLIPDEPMIVTITKTGYAKRLSPSSYRAQARGGKGVTGMTTKEEDEIEHLSFASAHDNILFFTNKGKVYQTKVYDLPEGLRQAKGQALINLINVDQGENVQSILTYRPAQDAKAAHRFVFLTTRQGTVKKTTIDQFANIRKNGLTAIKLETGDELVWAKLTSGSDDILIVTNQGKSIKFSEKEAKNQGRDTIGVRGIKLAKEDFVVGMESFGPDSKDEFLVVSERGVGKRTKVSAFPKQRRAGSGVKAIQITPKTGNLVTGKAVNENIEQVILTSTKGQVIKLPLTSVPSLSRATQGVILMRFSEAGDKVAAVASVEK